MCVLKPTLEVSSGPGSRFKGKHSLDSDEEDDGEDTQSNKYDILASDDVDGESLVLSTSCRIVFGLLPFHQLCN